MKRFKRILANITALAILVIGTAAVCGLFLLIDYVVKAA